MAAEIMMLLVKSTVEATNGVIMQQWETEELSCQGFTILQFQSQTPCDCTNAFCPSHETQSH